LLWIIWKRGRSDLRWKSVEQAKSVYAQLSSESATLKAVKEQIIIGKLGFGWTDCGHKWKWSENGYHFTSRDLLDHLIKTVIPLELKCSSIPKQPPVNISSGLANDSKLGTETALDYKDERFNVKRADEIRRVQKKSMNEENVIMKLIVMETFSRMSCLTWTIP
jgi:hypothetical protein